MPSTLTDLGPAPTIVEVAAYLRVNKATIYRLLYAGKLRVIKGFGRTRVCAKSLDKFLADTGVYEASTPGWKKPSTSLESVKEV